MDTEQKELAYFFGISYLFSWILTIPLALASNGIIGVSLPSYLTNLARLGPSIAAIIMISRSKDTSIKDFITSNLKIRVQPVWYLAALLLPGAIGTLSVCLGFLIRGLSPDFMWAAGLSVFPFLFLPVLFTGGPIGEEYGWRGYALPRLLKKYSVIKSNLILGLLWGLWYLPLFWTADSPHSQVPLLGYLVQIMAYSFIFTWIYRRTGGSLFIMMIFHAAWRTFIYLIPYLPPGQTGGTGLAYNIFLALLCFLSILTVFEK